MKKVVYIFSALILTLALVGRASAIVNIERMRDNGGEQGLSYQLKLKLTNQGGNSKANSQALNFRVDHLAGLYRSFAIFDHARAQGQGEDYQRQGMWHLRSLKWLKPERLGVEVFFQNSYNDFIELENRVLAGGGVRLAPVKNSENLKVYLGLGLMDETESYQTESRKRLLRSTNYMTVRAELTENLFFIMTSYYQPNVNNIDDFRLTGEGSLCYKLNKTVVLSLDANGRYDSQPFAGLKRGDWKYMVALSFLF